MELTDVAVDLYGLPLGEFTASRTARAKQARADGDRDLAARITALRKPTVAAWAVDLLVRARPDVVEDLLTLGERLQAAQAAFDGAALRELGREQHAAMAAVREGVDALAADAGQRLSDAVHVQVEGTLRAAMADPEAADAVRSGLLVGELVSSGFEPVDVGDAVAVAGAPSLTDGTATRAAPREAPADDASRRGADEPGASPSAAGRRHLTRSQRRAAEDRATRDPDEARRGGVGRGTAAREQARRERAEREAAAREDAARRRREEAGRDLETAEQEAAEATRALRSAEAGVAEVTRRHAELDGEILALTTRLRRLRDEQVALTVRERRAHAARDTAARTVEEAARRVRAAREQVERMN